MHEQPVLSAIERDSESSGSLFRSWTLRLVALSQLEDKGAPMMDSQPVAGLVSLGDNITIAPLRPPEKSRDRGPSSGRIRGCPFRAKKFQWYVGFLRGFSPARRRRRTIPLHRSG